MFHAQHVLKFLWKSVEVFGRQQRWNHNLRRICRIQIFCIFQIMFYLAHSSLVLSFCIDVILTLSVRSVLCIHHCDAYSPQAALPVRYELSGVSQHVSYSLCIRSRMLFVFLWNPCKPDMGFASILSKLSLNFTTVLFVWRIVCPVNNENVIALVTVGHWDLLHKLGVEQI